MGRQNGKSQLACAYQLLILLHFHAPLLISVASSADQARIVYQRLSTVIDTNPAIRSLFTALTDTRGIKKADDGRVEIKASKGQALQGLAIRAGLVDELHITTPEVWKSVPCICGEIRRRSLILYLSYVCPMYMWRDSNPD